MKNFCAFMAVVILTVVPKIGFCVEDERPNIVMILCDDLGYADVGFNGCTDIRTPAIDALAKNGMTFSSAYVTHPFCGPSRAALMTGRYPHKFGSQFNLPERGKAIGSEQGIPVDETFVSRVLQNAGYFTGLIGKWHLGKTADFHPNNRGFDEFYGFLGGGHKYHPNEYAAEYSRQRNAGNKNIWSYLAPLEHNGEIVTESEYLTDELSDAGIRFVRQASKRDQPFFLFLSYNAPHTPLEARKEDLGKYPEISDPKRKTYAAMVHAVDRGVGELVNELKTIGELDDTLIVFFSDNGGRLDQGASNAPLRGAKGDTTEGGYRVPMLFHWPGKIQPGTTFSYPVSALDIYPTFAGLAQASIPTGKQLDGKNIWSDIVANRNPRAGEMIFALRHRSPYNDIGARRDNWKIHRRGRQAWRLYAINNDISEENDLARIHPDVVSTMVKDIQDWATTHSEPRWFDSPPRANKWKMHGMPNFENTLGMAKPIAVESETHATVRETQNNSPKTIGRVDQDSAPISSGAPELRFEEPIYLENFDSAPKYVGATGPNDNNISSISFGPPTPDSPPNVTFGQYGGTSQYLAETKIRGGFRDGKFAIGSSKPVHQKSRNRSYMTFVDTSEAKVGQYNISFDVSQFQADDAEAKLYLHLYEGSIKNGRLDFQVTHQAMLPKFAPNVPGIRGQGGVLASILINNEIKHNGQFRLNFGLAEAGQPGDFLALVWSQVKRNGNSPMPSMTIDNVRVAKLAGPMPQPRPDDFPKTPFGQNGTWKLIPNFSDEFDGSEVDLTKWNNHPAHYGAMSWDEKNTIQKSGKLHLQLVHDPHIRDNQKLFYTSGIVRSHQQMTYGYYEARIKGCSLFPGACPAFWMFSDGRKYDGEVRYCEIDVAELQMNEINHESGQRNPVNYIDMNLHLRLADKQGKLRWVRPNMNPELCANLWKAPWDPRDDFHVYACDVTPEQITWFVDGEKVATKPNKYWHLPMNVALTMELRHPHIGWEGQTIWPVPQAATKDGFPTTMEIDYVRVWARQKQ